MCLAILLVALILRCSTNTSIRTDYKTRDLDPKLVSEFRTNSNYFYKFDPKYSVDYMVSLVRTNVFASKNTQNMGEILLSFGLIGRGKSFDCDEFFAKLTTEEKAVIKSQMDGHPFVCRKASYTSKEALASFPIALSEKIVTLNVADCHWSWFGATGDTEALRRLLDNFLYNPNACVRCIEWSYPSNAQQNADVKNYLVGCMSQKTDEEKKRLSILLPK